MSIIVILLFYLIYILIILNMLFVFFCITSHRVHWSLREYSIWCQCLIMHNAIVLIASCTVVNVGMLIAYLLIHIILLANVLFNILFIWLSLIMWEYRINFFNQFRSEVLLDAPILWRIKRNRCILEGVRNN